MPIDTRSRFIESMADVSRRVEEARFFAVDSVLYIKFDDGLERVVRWSELPFARSLAFAPAAAAPGAGGESVRLTDETGRDIEISGSSLRAALDSEYRARLRSGDDSERRAVGARIRALRKSASVSQQELASRAGMAQESLSRIETGRRDPRLGTLRRLARGLGLSLDQLMERLSVDC